MAVGCVEKLLQRAQLRNMLLQQFFVVLLRLVDGFDLRWPRLQIDLVSCAYAKVLFESIFIFSPPAVLVTWLLSVHPRRHLPSFERFIGSLGSLCRRSGTPVGLQVCARLLTWHGVFGLGLGIGRPCGLGLCSTLGSALASGV
jgi:hypothetical protein